MNDNKLRIRKLPLKERVRLYDEAISLRKKYGWGYIRIAKKLSIPEDVVRHWLYHGRNPLNQGNPHFFELKPSPELAYIIGVVLGDADLHVRSLTSERSGRIIRLRAKDIEFVRKFASAANRILKKRKSYKIGYDNKQFVVCVYSYYLHQFLSKPLEKLKRFIESYPLEFIKGVVDSEGSCKVNVWKWKKWKNLVINISITNTNLLLLKYLKTLFKKYLNIEASIKPSHKKGSKFKINGKEYVRKKDAFDLIIYKINDVKLFAQRVGFSIKRKYQKLLDGIKIIETYKGEDRVKAWLKIYKKERDRWIKTY